MTWDGIERRQQVSRSEVELIVRDVVRTTIREMQQEGVLFQQTQEHEDHHRFCERILKLLGKLDDVRWGVIKTLILALVVAALAVMGLNLSEYL